MEFAERAFATSAEVGDTGASQAAHLRQAKATAEKLGLPWSEENDELLDPGDPPPGFEFIWEVFLDLHSSRQSGFGPCAIAYSDIEAWCRLNRVRLKVWEIDIIKKLDRIYMKVSDEETKKSRDRDKADNPAPTAPGGRRHH